MFNRNGINIKQCDETNSNSDKNTNTQTNTKTETNKGKTNDTYDVIYFRKRDD